MNVGGDLWINFFQWNYTVWIKIKHKGIKFKNLASGIELTGDINSFKKIITKSIKILKRNKFFTLPIPQKTLKPINFHF